ncbi:MAG: class I SAM-dependent methyltransferase [Betaproteobacteria bacterium]
MTASLPFTGERFTPEVGGAIWYEHWHRYAAMLPLVRGLRALDAACGEGYGSWLLAGSAREVIGVDIDATAIGHAAQRYAGKANLRYVRASCTDLPIADACIDLIVSFETIEHLDGQDAMLAEFRRVLAPSGVLIISSPNKAIYSDETGYANEFHVRELTREELSAALDAKFPQQAWYGQRVMSHSVLWSERPPSAPRGEIVLLSGDQVHLRDAPAPPMYYIVVCGGPAAVLPRLADLSIFDDGRQSLYRDYDRARRAEKRLFWDEADARRIADARHAELVIAVNELASARERDEALVGELDRVNAERARSLADHAETLRGLRARLDFRESWRGWMRWPFGRALSMLSRRAP